MKRFPGIKRLAILIAVLSLALGCTKQGQKSTQQAPTTSTTILHARFYDSGFKFADDNYNQCFYASDGKVYYVLASGSPYTGSPLLAFNPATGKIEDLGDLTEAAGEKGLHAIPQGKGHSMFVEFQGKLYFATHVGYYSPPSPTGQELIGKPPAGYKPYPGGHFLSYDLRTGKFENFAKAPVGQGIISFTMDPQRHRLYGLTWPSGLFLRYDMQTHNLKNFGPVTEGGEKGIPGSTYRAICRILVVDPQDGSVYFTTAGGRILRYRYDTDTLETVQECSLKRDVFGCMDPKQPGTMGYNWRKAFWYAPQGVIYAQNGRSGYLFRFDPRKESIEILTRLVPDVLRKNGMFDDHKYGYLGMTLGPDGHTIYSLTGAPTQTAAKKTDEEIHLVTYNILSKKQVDWGILQLQNGLRPFFAQSIAIGHRNIYTVSKIKENGKIRTDLLSFPNPVR